MQFVSAFCLCALVAVATAQRAKLVKKAKATPTQRPTAVTRPHTLRPSTAAPVDKDGTIPMQVYYEKELEEIIRRGVAGVSGVDVEGMVRKVRTLFNKVMQELANEIKPSGGDCVDRADNCASMRHLCEKQEYANLMRQKCRKTCRLC